MTTTHWHQLNIEFPDRQNAQRLIVDVIGPDLAAAESQGLLTGWWYMNKQPWPLRYLSDSTGCGVIHTLLDQLADNAQISGWTAGIYEPETFTFGGEAAMDAAHTLFHHDSRHLLTYGQSPGSGHLGRRETMALLSSAMMRSAGLDYYEQGDVWAKVAELRPPAGNLPAQQNRALAAAMRRLLTASTRALCTATGPLAGHEPWVAAFEEAGQTLGALARAGGLTRGLRAVLAHHLIFHANRAGLSLADQSAMSALAREVVMGTSDSTVSSPGAGPARTSVGEVNSDTVKDPHTAAEHLRIALVDQIVKEGRVHTPRIKVAMQTVPRHLFVPDASLDEAYANSTVDIKHNSDGASISCASQPGVVGTMLEQLQPQPGHNVLELGAGTGYNAALLGHLVGSDGHVTTIDVDDDLVDGARAHLAAAGIENVTVVQSDGALGQPDGAPYDRIIATVGAHGIPQTWLEQLAPGGRLLVPQRLRGSVSRSIAYEHTDGVWGSVCSEMNTFMPLRRGIADDDRRLIPVTADGSVRLQTSNEQSIEADTLADVLDQPGSVVWADVFYRAMESPEWMELWLSCTLPSGLNQMPFKREAVGSLLHDDPYPSSTAVFDKGALTYLVRRLSSDRTPEGGKLWEFGVVGHGPGSDELAERVAESMRTWDREYRDREARFELQPLDAKPAEPGPGRFIIDTPLNRIVVDWQ